MNFEDLIALFQTYTFDYFMNEALSRVPQGIDIREGSIIYDALAPAAWLFTEQAQNISNVLINANPQTATGDFLDNIAPLRGLSREQASYAQVTATVTDPSGNPFPMVNLPVGTRFSTVETAPIYFDMTSAQADGQFTLTAETAGGYGNRYIGQILPVDNINNLGYAQITAITVPARDVETDDAFRTRILDINDSQIYGGNVQDYISMIQKIGDVGAVQVYPTWKGGGTVLLAILDNNFELPTAALVTELQAAIDPLDSSGNGYGLAPIGHTVTVEAPTALTINIAMTITVESTTTIAAVTPAIETAVQSFISNLVQSSWATQQNGRGYAMTVYQSKFVAAVVNVSGVLNVSTLTLNGSTADVVVEMNNTDQQVPVLGSVTVNG